MEKERTCVEVFGEIKCLREVLRRVKEVIASKKARLAEACARAKKEAKKATWGAAEKVVWLRNELHTAREKVKFLEYWLDQEKSVVVELTKRAATSEAATRAAKDKVERMKAKTITNQVKLIRGILKVSLTAYQIG